MLRVTIFRKKFVNNRSNNFPIMMQLSASFSEFVPSTDIMSWVISVSAVTVGS
jgi:hypothetical protein